MHVNLHKSDETKLKLSQAVFGISVSCLEETGAVEINIGRLNSGQFHFTSQIKVKYSKTEWCRNTEKLNIAFNLKFMNIVMSL